MTRRPLPARRAREIVDAAKIVRAPDWRDTRNWHVVDAYGTVLVVIEPSYGGTSRTGRNGWNWWLAEGVRARHQPEPSREKASVVGLLAWQRWVTRRPA